MFATIVCGGLGALAYIPRPTLPDGSLDGSWGLVLQEAAIQGWQFGTRLAFTYGPLGYLAVPSFSPVLFWRTVWVRIALGLLCGWMFSEIGRAWKWPVWSVPTLWLLVLTPAAASFDVPWFLPVLLWPFLALAPRGSSRVETALIASVAGMLALVKFTTLVASVGVVAILTIDDARRRQPPVAAAALAASVVLGWVLAGQDTMNLLDWFRTSWQTAAGYSEAMSTPVGPYQVRELALFACSSAALLGFVTYLSSLQRASRLLPLATALLLFLQFKLGFVRQDAHVTSAMFAMPLMSVLGAASGMSAVASRALKITAAGRTSARPRDVLLRAPPPLRPADAAGAFQSVRRVSAWRANRPQFAA